MLGDALDRCHVAAALVRSRKKGLYMTAEEVLKKVMTLERAIRSISNQLAKLRADLYSIKGTDYSRIRVDGGMSEDIADRLSRIEEKVKELEQAHKELLDYRDKIEGVIDSMPTPEYGIIIRGRYLYRDSWSSIASVLLVSREWVRKELHPKAVKEFEEQLQKLQ